MAGGARTSGGSGVEVGRLDPVELPRGHRLGLAVGPDLGRASRAQVADPLDVAVGPDDPAPVVELDDGDGRRARQPARSTSDGQEHVRSHRRAEAEQPAGEGIGSADKAWSGGQRKVLGHVRVVAVVNRLTDPDRKT